MRVSWIHPLGSTNVCPEFHVGPSSGCFEIFPSGSKRWTGWHYHPQRRATSLTLNHQEPIKKTLKNKEPKNPPCLLSLEKNMLSFQLPASSASCWITSRGLGETRIHRSGKSSSFCQLVETNFVFCECFPACVCYNLCRIDATAVTATSHLFRNVPLMRLGYAE